MRCMVRLRMDKERWDHIFSNPLVVWKHDTTPHHSFIMWIGWADRKVSELPNHILSITISFLSQFQYYTQFPMHWATTLSRTCYLRSFHYKIRLIAFSAYMPFEYGRKNQKETYWIIIFKNNFSLFKTKKENMSNNWVKHFLFSILKNNK